VRRAASREAARRGRGPGGRAWRCGAERTPPNRRPLAIGLSNAAVRPNVCMFGADGRGPASDRTAGRPSRRQPRPAGRPSGLGPWGDPTGAGPTGPLVASDAPPGRRGPSV